MTLSSLTSAYEQAVSDQKLRLEMSQVRRQHNHYLENVERSKQVTAIVDRKKKRGQDLLEVGTVDKVLFTLPLPLPPPSSPSSPPPSSLSVPPPSSPSTHCEDSDNAE